MDNITTAILDLSGCKYIRDFHQRIKTALKFPEFYGGNWSAFWDSLSTDSTVEYVIIRGSNTLDNQLKSSFEQMIILFEKRKLRDNLYGLFFDYIIES